MFRSLPWWHASHPRVLTQSCLGGLPNQPHVLTQSCLGGLPSEPHVLTQSCLGGLPSEPHMLTQRSTANAMVPSISCSSILMGPIACSLAVACRGASGVSVT